MRYYNTIAACLLGVMMSVQPSILLGQEQSTDVEATSGNAGSSDDVAEPVPSQPLLASAEFSWNPEKYVQLRIVARRSDELGSEQISFGNCPNGEFAGLNFNDIFKSNRTTLFGINITSPGQYPIEFPIVQTEIDKPFLGGRKCRIQTLEFEYRSPVYLMSRHENSSFSVSPFVKFREGLGGFNLQALQTVGNAVARLSSLPADATGAVSEISGGIIEGTSISSSETNAVQFVIGEAPVFTTRSWTIEGDAASGVPAMELTAELVNVDGIIRKGSDQDWVAQIPFTTRFDIDPNGLNPERSLLGYLRLYASAELADFNSAGSVEAFEIPCIALSRKLSELGLSPRDNALLMWGLATTHPVLLNFGDIDHTNCMDIAWQSLPDGITKRTPDTTEPELRAPTVPEMQLSIEVGQNLVRLLTTADGDRAAAANSLFGTPLEYNELGQRAVMRSRQIRAQAPAGWLYELPDRDLPLFDRVGCLVYFEDGEEFDFLALAERQLEAQLTENIEVEEVQQNEEASDDPRINAPAASIIRLAFNQVRDGDPATVGRFVINSEPTPEEIALIKASHSSSCEFGWKPAGLYGQIN